MPIEVVLPKVDMDMESGVIAAWKVAEGDFVRMGDVLFEMETNKSLMEVESPGTGTIRALTAVDGEEIAVGTPVAWIHEDGAGSIAATDSVVANDDEVAAGAPAESLPTPTLAASTPAPSAPIAAPAPTHASDHSGLRATPLARRTARINAVDLATVSGSGPRGRIVEQDVLAHTPRVEATAANLVPFSPIRRIVAQRLAESARTAPHFYLTAQIEMTALFAAIERVGPDVEGAVGTRPSLTVMLAYLVGRVLASHPLVNASVEGDATRFNPHAHIGIAMERDGDLVVPVLRDADTLPLPALVREFAVLRDAVRAKTIAPAKMRGGTFTISNLGMYGVDSFTAIINPPESAILAIGRTVDTPVGRDGAVVLRPMATFSLSSDHRIVDGVTAARFMADLRAAIEAPDTRL
jgi:pyruvate dehydrogenase E2 component (dihydrolipoamide acetyltransferase)